jgi:hypothetical protein
MAIPLPKSRLQRIWARPSTYDIGGLCAGIIASAGSAFRFFLDGRNDWGFALSGGAVLQAIFGALKWRAALRDEVARDSTEDLVGCLHTLAAVLLYDVPDGDDPKLRLTIHVPTGDGRLLQICDYVGDQRVPKTAHRTFPVQSGITGKAFREREVITGSRENDDYESYIKELVSKWNYTEADARKTDPATKAWLAIPLVRDDNRTVDGVLYLDSTDRDFFIDTRRLVAMHAAVWIAVFVGRRYTD